MSQHSQADQGTQADFTEKLAAQGHASSTKLLTFASLIPSRDPYTLGLASTILTTSHVLTSLLSAPIPSIPSHPTIHSLCLGIKSMFDRVEVVLQDMSKWEADGEFVQKKEAKEGEGRTTTVVERGNEVIEELGGWAKADAFHWRLEGLRGGLVCVFDSVLYLGLKKMEKEGTLGEEDKEMLKKVSERIPNVVTELEKRKRDMRGTVEDILKGIEMGTVKADKPSPRLRARDDDDVISIRSFDSAATVQFVEEKEQYEYWLIQKIEGDKKTVRSWGFLGMRVTEDLEDTAYFVEGKPRPQKQMKARDDEAKTDEEKAKREARIQKTLATMPRRLSTEIGYIIQDRERTSSNTKFIREWSLVDLKPLKPKIHTPAISWGAWWKGQGGTSQWECIIKGVTVETAEEKMKIPNRYDDPFRKHQRRPIIERYPEPRELYPRPIAVERFEPRSREAYVQVETRRRDQGFVIPELSEEEREEKVAELLAAVTVPGEGTEVK